MSDKREAKAARDFANEVARYGYPDWGIRCKHGVQGGLVCEWCGNPDRLPDEEKLRRSSTRTAAPSPKKLNP